MLTLQELKQVVSNREERRKVPSAKYLRENDVAVAKQRLMDCAEIIAYQTGYVLYCVGDYATVFPLFTCRDYVYEAERKIASEMKRELKKQSKAVKGKGKRRRCKKIRRVAREHRKDEREKNEKHNDRE